MDPYQLEDVFKLSGVPEVTFVEPVEFPRLLIALRTRAAGSSSRVLRVSARQAR